MSQSLAVRPALRTGALALPEGLSDSAVREVLDLLAARDRDGEVLTAVRHFPARAAEFAEWVRGDLRAAYLAKGIRRPYTHQADAAAAVHAGKNVVMVTPTASGKT